MTNLEITKGHPFEYEWEVDFDIFGEDYLDGSIPFIIRDKNGENVLSLEFNYGMTIAKFNNEDRTRLIISIYETDILENGEYTYVYEGKTLSGKEVANLYGKIKVSSEKSDTVPVIKREARPWDLFRSKKSAEGERVTEEKRKERLSTCEQCPRFVKLTSQCMECGCIMKLKTKLAHATCPLGKW